ncbi:Isochorismatase-like protein [Polychytrium aggregatum]|uniref:Isochorismatase-like protein n=1 Tax=Polychytrium aggregatum TaxID=110093 RepID=UPI0022FEDF9E|nr:Isochorismatase-like protein [Polychytrium aggregatum]KAI9207981.1 Isochorismatase-like protein [Polychytrium aggregatum]
MSAIAVRALRTRIHPSSTAFFLCDIQEKFKPHIYQYHYVISTAKKMISAGKLLDIPLIVTEQNPKGLGPTDSQLDIEDARIITPKTKFSMWTPEVQDTVHRLGTKSVVLFGIESHVCVLQTALDLLDADLDVYVLRDGVSSMNAGEIPIAIEFLRTAGCKIVSSESVLFQLLQDASHPQFKAISGLVKESKDTTKATFESML